MITWFPRLARIAPRLAACGTLLLSRRSILHSLGWIESQRRGYPCRANGEELPWMNYAVIGLLEQRLPRECRVFEYGCGYSTSFFARRAREVVSVEHNREWLERIAGRVPPHVRLVWTPADCDGAYCRAIHHAAGNFDLVVVDGWDRVHCVRECLANLSPRGVLLLDDSDRLEYAAAFERLAAAGFRQLRLDGLKPTRSASYQTTIFYRDGNCLGI